MNRSNYPVPIAHKTFPLDSVTIDSNFDSGNLYDAAKANQNTFNLWIAVDHPKNQYRTWFYFSIQGIQKGVTANFNIKNMQNQSRLLNEGLLPVYREEGAEQWSRVAHKIDLSKIEYNHGWIEWTFSHTFLSQKKVFFAFFYPWSNNENDVFLEKIKEDCKQIEDIYFKRSTIIKSLEGRPVQFLTISSKKHQKNQVEKFQDDFLFPNGQQPKEFSQEKKCIIIGARVHPGQVPSSHVMTGIIRQLTQSHIKAKTLRDKFVFYIFPIINPDGVARGHYRVDPKGINLNRCYINPSPKFHSPIYAIKKVIAHLHKRNRYFGFLDLHAHAARKGVFIYGNSINQLEKQVQICMFPKILSLNSQIFQYQGSNFTEQNMYVKDKNDHISKQGAGRVAIFKSTNNPYSWTLECNYNSSRIINEIDDPRNSYQIFKKPNENELNSEIIINYKYPVVSQPKEFYTIHHFRQLGKEICDSFLDLMEINPQSRIDNSKSHFKSVQNLKMNLAIALLRMAPNRFQSHYKKIYNYIEGPSTNKEYAQRSLQALYFLLIKKAKIQNLGSFLKENDNSSLILPPNVKIPGKNKVQYKIRLKIQSHSLLKRSQHSNNRSDNNTLDNEQPQKPDQVIKNEVLDQQNEQNKPQEINIFESKATLQKNMPINLENFNNFYTRKYEKAIKSQQKSNLFKGNTNTEIRYTISKRGQTLTSGKTNKKQCVYRRSTKAVVITLLNDHIDQVGKRKVISVKEGKDII